MEKSLIATSPFKTLADLQKKFREESNADFGEASIAYGRCAQALSPFVVQEAKDYDLILNLRKELYSYSQHPHWNKSLIDMATARLNQ